MVAAGGLAEQVGQPAGALVLKDERGLDVPDVVLAEREDEAAQVVGAAGRDVDEEVVLPGDVVGREDLGQGPGAALEVGHPLGGVAGELDEDHGLKVDAERGGATA